MWLAMRSPDVQLAEGRGGGLPCPVFKIGKRALILEKYVLFKCTNGLSAPKFFPAGPFFCVEMRQFQENYPALNVNLP